MTSTLISDPLEEGFEEGESLEGEERGEEGEPLEGEEGEPLEGEEGEPEEEEDDGEYREEGYEDIYEDEPLEEEEEELTVEELAIGEMTGVLPPGRDEEYPLLYDSAIEFETDFALREELVYRLLEHETNLRSTMRSDAIVRAFFNNLKDPEIVYPSPVSQFFPYLRQEMTTIEKS